MADQPFCPKCEKELGWRKVCACGPDETDQRNDPGAVTDADIEWLESEIYRVEDDMTLSTIGVESDQHKLPAVRDRLMRLLAAVERDRQRQETPDALTRLNKGVYGPMDWPEDAGHENGRYVCRCYACQVEFIGHKRRPACKECSQETPDLAAAREAVEEAHADALARYRKLTGDTTVGGRVVFLAAALDALITAARALGRAEARAQVDGLSYADLARLVLAARAYSELAENKSHAAIALGTALEAAEKLLGKGSPLRKAGALTVTPEEVEAARAFYDYGATRGNHADEGRGPVPGPLTPHRDAMGALVRKLAALGVSPAQENHETQEKRSGE